MKPPKNLIIIPELTRSAIRGVPKSWHELSKTYLHPITSKEVFVLNVMSVIVGLVAGYTAIGFRKMIGLFQNLFLHHQVDWSLISPLEHVRGYWILAILPLGLLISTLLTRFFAPEATGHGVPEVIEAVMAKGGKMRARVVAIKALASSITIASGGSVGREGPIIQIGSAAGSVIGQLLKLDAKLIKTLVGCGAAAAIAATFNTPIAGVIFAIEIIVLELKTKSFVPLVIATVFATIVSRMHIGNEPAFFAPSYILKTPTELIFYLGLGLLSGVVGVIVIRSVYGFEDFFERWKIPFWLKPLIGGLILALISLEFPQMLGVGYETVTDALQQNSHWYMMFLFVGLKIFCTSLTLAAGGSGGVFAPSLFIGAMLGGAYGLGVEYLFPGVTGGYGAYALVGMAAMFSATGRATFTAIVILFEMTLDYSIILPLMFVCVTADQIAWAISKDSIYSLKLKRKGYQFVNDISVNVMSITHVKDIMTTKVDTVLNTTPIGIAAQDLLKFNHSIYPVVDDSFKLLGVLSHKTLLDLHQTQPHLSAEQAMSSVSAIVGEYDTVQKALTKIEKTRDPRVLVINHRSGQLVGIVSPIDFVRLSSAQVD